MGNPLFAYIFWFLIEGRMSQYHVLATPERYWAQAFPNTLMPDIIRARLRPLPSGLLHVGSSNRDPRFLYSDFTKEHLDPRETTLFLEEDLKVGMNKIFHFRMSDFNNASPFLSREDASTTPFSTVEFPRILHRFSLPPVSREAQEVWGTLTWCESLEAKAKCLTSLEAMINYANSSTMGHNITMLHTIINNASVVQAYTVKKVERKDTKPSSAVCHNMPYPFAVYSCHYIGEGRIYKVSLEGEDGSMVEAITACHPDSLNWIQCPYWYQSLPAYAKPDHQNYSCHFLPDTHIVWAST
ncbi:hypothetical protein AMTRI_Chr09g40550 [Amborella trichopoda]